MKLSRLNETLEMFGILESGTLTSLDELQLFIDSIHPIEGIKVNVKLYVELQDSSQSIITTIPLKEHLDIDSVITSVEEKLEMISESNIYSNIWTAKVTIFHPNYLNGNPKYICRL